MMLEGALPVVLLDGSSGAIEFLLWLVAGLAVLGLTWLVGLVVAFCLAVGIQTSTRLEILCVALAAIHVAAGFALRDIANDGLGLVREPAFISLTVGPLVLTGVVVARVRRWRRRQDESNPFR